MKNFLLILFGFAISNTFSQNLTSSTSAVPFIEVVGTAIKEIDPNQIFISIVLSEKSIDNKKYSIQSQEEKLYQILKNLNIDSNKLTLSDLTSQILRDKKNEIGFKQTKEYTLLLSNADEVSLLFKQLFDANIKEADVIRTEHTEIVEYTKQTRIDALKSAKAKAEYLLEAIGSKIGQPLEIIEQNNIVGRDLNYYRGNAYATQKAEYISLSTDFKKIVISISYKVKYSVK